MSFQVPTEKELKETFAKIASVWFKPSVLERLDAVCSVSGVDRSKVLRFMAILFLNDNTFQLRVLKGVRRCEKQ